MRLRRPRRAELRTRVLAGVLLVTLAALAAFDVAAVTALRSYLIGQTDSELRNVARLYRLVNVILPPAGASAPGKEPAADPDTSSGRIAR